QIGDTGVALPPILMGPLQAGHHDADLLGMRGIRRIPDVMLELAVGTQDVGVARCSLRQARYPDAVLEGWPRACAHHRAVLAFSAWNMKQLLRMFGIGD